MSSVRLFVLGVIRREQQAHGYKVYRELVDWQADKWTSLKPGSIYHALSQLEKERCIEAAGHEESTTGPSRTIYKMTDKGEREFLELEAAVLQNADLDIEAFAAGLAFMQELPRDEVLTYLRSRHELLIATAEFMTGLPRSEQPKNPSELPPLVTLWSGFFEQLVTHSSSLICEVEEGKYNFL